MKTAFGRAAFLAAITTLGGLASAQGAGMTPATPAASRPDTRLLFVDRHAIMNGSKVGTSIRAQIMAYENKIQDDLGPEDVALRKDTEAFQSQSASLPADVRAKKNLALQQRQAVHQQKMQDRENLVHGGEVVAGHAYFAAVKSVVHAIMLERGATAVIDKGAMADSIDGLDITSEVIRRLDRQMADYKVPLVKPSADDEILATTVSPGRHQ
jgi:Skp family chaperone for outer membrane proteins